MTTNYNKFFEKDYQNLMNKFNKTSENYKQLKYEYQLLKAKYNTKKRQLEIALEHAENSAFKKYEDLISEKDKKLLEKDNEIARLKSLLNLDSTNSGISTSKTPINKKKNIPNSRVKSNKPIGGQKGHKKHKLEKFSDDEINDEISYTLENCPYCNSSLEITGEISKDELSFRFVPIKRRHKFITYKCSYCNHEVHEKIPTYLKEENQYGSELQALILSLGNEANVSLNKIRRIIRGFSHNEIDVSEGYISKLQKKASQKLEEFKKGLYLELLKQELLYWDDTVIMINKKRGCLRFYGTDKLAFYVSHLQKNKDGILKDSILNTLSNNTKVMHDHNKINYNQEFSFVNIECNVHLLRELEKCNMNTCHEWCSELKKLIQRTLHERKELIEKKIEKFNDEYIINFDGQFNNILLKGIEENKCIKDKYYHKDEMTLINRILDYKTNYFMWLHDFSIPTDDNMSERALRGVKSKMKIAGQFQNIEYAKYYANIRSYIETCYRNNINPTDALIRLMENKPYTIEEILKIGKHDTEKNSN